MKKRLPVLFLFILSTIMLASCCKRETAQYKLTAEDLKWNPYIENQTIVFVNDTGAYDTFLVTNIERPFSYNCGDKSCCKENWTESLWVSISGRIQSGGITISTEIVRLSWGFDEKTSNATQIANVSIGGNNYSDVYLFERDRTGLPDYNIYKFYFNKEYGFLRFDRVNGTYWELVR